MLFTNISMRHIAQIQQLSILLTNGIRIASKNVFIQKTKVYRVSIPVYILFTKYKHIQYKYKSFASRKKQ